ncbi:LrgB family protein [Rossellomorea marisflavi]|uniref:LrgB family protein n=1 Tax=Rossellomorea marisflavi TaxID=189381 RepID=UPI0025AF0489|nr:LrgB family protein [Rossellomorea marisflavi]WJV16847.1 LrgB family protein [Rossellomorea marisflavi]
MTMTGEIVAISASAIIFLLANLLYKKWTYPLLLPIFTSTLVIIGGLLFIELPYAQYAEWTRGITYLLGPATVALAYPLYHQRRYLKAYALPIVLGLVIGSLAQMTISFYMGKFLRLPEDWNLAVMIKTITTPVALGVGDIIGAKIEVIPSVVIITGMLGAMAIIPLLRILRIDDAIVTGLTFGVTSHGVGTARALKEGEVEGAVSGAVMALTSMVLSVIIPLVFFLFS